MWIETRRKKLKRLTVTTLFVCLAFVAATLLSCGPAPTPEVVKEVVKETVVVEKEVEVEVEVTKVVEVEKEVVVTATPEPAPESPTLARAQERGFLYVGNVQEAGFAYINEEGEFAGLDADIARYVANELGIEDIVSVHLAWDGLIPSLLAERTDTLACGMAIKPKRCEVVAFTNPYHILGPTALVEKGNPFDIHSIQDIADNPDFIAGGMSGSLDIDVLLEYDVPEEQIRSYDEISLAFEDLKAGRLDAVIGTAPSHQMWLEGADMGDKFEIASPWDPPPGFSYPAALVFRHEDQALVEMASEIIEQMKVDGTLAQLAEKNGFPVEILAPPCAESDVGCMVYHCPEAE
jgi:polar amino acid transport system substrate-binding protein